VFVVSSEKGVPSNSLVCDVFVLFPVPRGGPVQPVQPKVTASGKIQIPAIVSVETTLCKFMVTFC
jgi:hypothetical protein